jgi:TonB-dependent receptor
MLFNAYNSTQRDINVRQFQFDKDNQNTKAVIRNPERNLDLITNMFTAEYNAGFALLDWTFSHSNINNEELNDNTLDFIQLGTEIPLGIVYETIHPSDLMQSVVPDSTSFVNEASHDSYSVAERNYMADMNVKIPYRLGNMLTGEIKFGGRYKINNRSRSSVSGDWLVRLEERGFPIQDFFDNSYDPGNFLDGQSSIGLILDPSRTNDFYNDYKHNYSINDFQAETYSAEDRIGAGYLMTRMQIGRMITFIPGVRYEQFNGTYTGEYRFRIGFRNGVKEEKTEEIIHRDWLPMVNLIIRPVDWFNARFAVTRTLVRPSYNNLLPRLSLNMQQANDRVSQGNPGLQPTRAWNYDAYLTFNHKYIGFFTIGAFYKELDGVIFNIERFISSVEQIDSLGLAQPFYVFEGQNLSYLNRRLSRPENSEISSVTGVELDWQTNFRFLPSPFNGIVLSANYTRLWSNTFYPYFLVENLFDPRRRPPFYQEYRTGLREGRVRGQSDHIVNLSLGYDFKGLSARVSMTYQGESLNSVSTQPEKDRFNEDWIRWDLSLKQKITPEVESLL